MSVHESIRALPEWNRLVEMVRELAFLDGGSDDAFTLASGRHSRWFFDMKREQGWEVVSSSPHVLHDKTGVRKGIVVIFKRKKSRKITI